MQACHYSTYEDKPVWAKYGEENWVASSGPFNMVILYDKQVEGFFFVADKGRLDQRARERAIDLEAAKELAHKFLADNMFEILGGAS